jgi:flagellar basal body-associated protein FliL
MAENQNDSPKVEENPTSTVSPPPDPDLISLDDLDTLIAQEDPDFAKGLGAVATPGDIQNLNIELIDLDQLMLEEKANSNSGKIKRLIKSFRTHLRIFETSLETSLIYFLREGLPEFLKKSKTNAGRFFKMLNEGRRQFSYWPERKKYATISLFAAVVGTVFFIYLAYTRTLLPVKTDLFTLTLEDVADRVETYDPVTGSEPFYDSSRASQNVMSLQKMVVNLHRSQQSGPNPMGAFEFYIEGNSPDVMVEIKDREYEVKDLFQRNIEDMSFDQMENSEGKQLLLEKLRREVNRMLTKGRIRKVFFKTAILKP